MVVTAISTSDARDQVPVRAAKPPRCFGAAARDPGHPCNNPSLKFAVVPNPSEAALTPSAPCTIIEQTALSPICEFGTPSARAAGTIALVGDSHAEHWRAALEVVAHAKRWRGISMTRPACPFALNVPTLDEPLRSQCIQWNAYVLQWFARHPEVRTVFASATWASRVLDPWSAGELQDFRNRIAGYIAAWKALPTSVEHIIVIRDTPRSTINTPGCIMNAIAKRKRPGLACALPRSQFLLPDPGPAAAAQLASPRVHVVDLTRFICDSRRCYPVVGGALVFKDTQHLTRVFSTTLGPFLLHRLDGLRARDPRPS